MQFFNTFFKRRKKRRKLFELFKECFTYFFLSYLYVFMLINIHTCDILNTRQELKKVIFIKISKIKIERFIEINKTKNQFKDKNFIKKQSF